MVLGLTEGLHHHSHQSLIHIQRWVLSLKGVVFISKPSPSVSIKCGGDIFICGAITIVVSSQISLAMGKIGIAVMQSPPIVGSS